MVPIILVVVACILIFVNVKFGNKELSLKEYIDNGNRLKINKDSEFQSKLKNIDFTDDKLQIGQIRKDVAESLTEIQKEIIKVNERIDLIEQKNNNIKKSKAKTINKVINDDLDEIVKDNTNNKESDQKQKNESDFSETLHKKITNSNFNNKKHIKKNDNEYEGVINDISLDSKTQRIKKLIKQGLSDEEICEKLHVGKGEILLVKGLLNKN
ncbi:hypothetical protein ACTNDG_01075 [Clostridium sp. HCP1S3_B4]|uniref:hypothetical protein n=1 Tax=unclassified Clostridium TaxID=2614128 RepID=UPI002A7E87F6|nr:hypothetical protein [Clostridiales bacterium]MDY2729254.1 hypothetical protein [Clostridium sp.]